MEKSRKNYVILSSIIIVSFLIGSFVTAQPTNSNLLEDVWNAILGIEAEVEEISDDVMVIESNLELLERIHELEIRVAILETFGVEESNGFPSPDFDSGWIEWDKEVHGTVMSIPHTLNTVEYFVYLIGRYDTVGGEPIDPPITDPNHFHTWGWGGDWGYFDLVGEQFKLGIHYEAYQNSIKILRAFDDPYSDYIRVMCWKLPSPS